MDGVKDIRRAIRIQRRYPEFLKLNWTRIAMAMLLMDDFTTNEIGRILGFDKYQMITIRVAINNFRMCGIVRKRGNKYHLIRLLDEVL